jgi:betaine-aldehyde dehydrogenase
MDARNFINGKWVDARSNIANISPNDGCRIGAAPLSSQEDVDSAVCAARVAFQDWKAIPIQERASVLMRAADILGKEYGKEGEPTPLKLLINREMGKRLPEADVEVIESADMLSFFSNEGPDHLASRKLSLNKELWPSKDSRVEFEPVGVVAAIKAWNYPLEIPIWTLGAALIAGNTVVLKPSEFTPLVASHMVGIMERAGLPAGVINLVAGDGRTGAALVRHPDVDMISFTGSIPVGREIASECAGRLRRTSLELGGKDVMVVLPDADIDTVVNGALWGAFTNCGQVCVGVRRLLLHDSISQNVLDRLVAKTKALRIGTDLGPLVSLEQLAKVELHVKDASEKGASVVCGGKRPSNSELQGGFYYEPTILTGVTPDMIVHKEDTFGPVVAVSSFATLDEAAAVANAGDYDLGASVWSSSIEAAEDFSHRLDVGMVWINDVNIALPQAPWCARRKSGNGIELSEFSLHGYTYLKHISIERGNEASRPWWFPYKG